MPPTIEATVKQKAATTMPMKKVDLRFIALALRNGDPIRQNSLIL